MKKALYEAVLRDVDRYEELARRAEGFADDELAGFFRGIRDENRRRAEEARRLLAQERGLLRTVDARQSLDKVARDVLDALGNPEGLRYYAS